MQVAIQSLPYLWQGLLVTLAVSGLVVGLSLLFGVVLGTILCYGPAPVRWAIRIYSDVIRGIPILVLIFSVYYGLPPLGINLNNFVSAVAALTLFTTAQVIEITRGAIQSIHFGQTEAGKAIGLGVLVLVCVGRLYLAVDHPFDVVVGIAMGVGIPLLGFRYFTPNELFPVSYRMYHTDSKACVIYAYDFDVEHGEISNRRVFADLNGGQGRPDGCTVDSDGRLWTAMLGGSRVAVFDPEARPVGSLHLPVSRPTSLCFGGPALETLYVTAMQHSLTEVEIAAQPLAGCTLAFAGIARGLPEPFFGKAQCDVE